MSRRKNDPLRDLTEEERASGPVSTPWAALVPSPVGPSGAGVLPPRNGGGRDK